MISLENGNVEDLIKIKKELLRIFWQEYSVKCTN